MNYTEQITNKTVSSHLIVSLKNDTQHDTKLVNKVYETIRKLESGLRNNPNEPSILYELYDMATGKVGFDYPLSDRVMRQIEKTDLLENGKMSQAVKDIIDASLILNEDLSFTLQHPRAHESRSYNKHL